MPRKISPLARNVSAQVRRKRAGRVAQIRGPKGPTEEQKPLTRQEIRTLHKTPQSSRFLPVPRFHRTRPAQFERTPAVKREEWKSRTVWPARPRWHALQNIFVREVGQSRLRTYYDTVLADDLMYMHYQHEPLPRPPPPIREQRFDLENPYVKNRWNPSKGEKAILTRKLAPSTPDNIVRLERIQIHTFVREAIRDRGELLSAIAAFRALTGESPEAGGRHNQEGVRIVKGRRIVGGWIRRGVPCGVVVDIKGDRMYDFLGTFAEFVLPRIRDFPGIRLERPGANPKRMSAVTGVVSLGLQPRYLELFPQIAVNKDAYLRLPGVHIHFFTNAKGQGAQNQARALLSGFQIPFKRV